MAANDAAIEMRRSAKQKEQAEVEAILAYQAMKVTYRLNNKTPPSSRYRFTLHSFRAVVWHAHRPFRLKACTLFSGKNYGRVTNYSSIYTTNT